MKFNGQRITKKTRGKKGLYVGALCSLMSAGAYAEDAHFDALTLKARGINADVAKYFSASPRFLPGVTTVAVNLNGKSKGKVAARFTDDGSLCADAEFLDAIGLKPVEDAVRQSQPNPLCLSYNAIYPASIITLTPSNGSIDVVVPIEALSADHAPVMGQDVTRGGGAGMLNYSLFSTQNSAFGHTTSRSQGAFDIGVNGYDWALRSRQMVTIADGSMTNDSAYTYAQRTMTSIKMAMQVGQINMNSALFSGAQISGIQFMPETGLQQDAEGSGITVTGVAQTAQARVDVRQSGVLIYSTLVPAGFFTLTDVPVINFSSDLAITVVETDGQESRFTVSASALTSTRLERPAGLSLAVGKVRQSGADGDSPMVGMLSDGWRVTNGVNIHSEMMLSKDYQSLGGRLNVIPIENVSLSSGLLVSKDDADSVKGRKVTLAAGYSSPIGVGINLSMEQNSKGYRELLDSTSHRNETPDDFSTTQYNVGLSWSDDTIGNLSLGYSKTKSYGESDSTQRLVGAWGKGFQYASVSVNWQRDIGHSPSNTNKGDNIYANISIPLGQSRVNTYVRRQDDVSVAGVRTNGRANDEVSYSLSVERDTKRQQDNVGGGVHANLHYTQLGVNASQNGPNRRSYSATANGGIAAHGNGITFSPYAIRDTFGIVSVSQDISGVAIKTPQGKVWTDAWGQAVVSSLPAYKKSRVELDSTTLPKQIDVNNGFMQVTAGYGSVSNLSFDTNSVRRILLNVTLSDGSKLPRGTLITNAKNEYVSTTVADGVVFVNDILPDSKLFALTDKENSRCLLSFDLPRTADFDAYYETINAVCK